MVFAFHVVRPFHWIQVVVLVEVANGRGPQEALKRSIDSSFPLPKVGPALAEHLERLLSQRSVVADMHQAVLRHRPRDISSLSDFCLSLTVAPKHSAMRRCWFDYNSEDPNCCLTGAM